MERIARHFLANPTRKNQLLALVLKLDFGNNDALENAVVNVHLPHSPGLLDEETLFLQSIVSTYGREHPLGVGDRDLILELRLRNTDPWSLDGDRRNVIPDYPNPHLAILVCGDQTIAESHAANRYLSPFVISDQELALDLDRAVV